jgi:hypothetical protein
LPGISHDGGAIRADEHGTRPVVTRPGTVAVRADWNDPTYRCARCGWPSWTWLCRVCAAAVRTDDLALAA